MTVSAERRAALRGFFEDSQRGQNRGVTFVEVSDILGVLDDLDLAERRERINLRAFEDLLSLGNCDKQKQEMGIVAWRRLTEIAALDEGAGT